MTTEIFRISPTAYARHLMRLWIRAHWWLVVLPPAASIAVAIAWDWRFLFVAVILIFLVLPHIMVTVYYYHALSPRAAMSILPHTVSFGDDGLTLTYEPPGDSDAASTSARPDDHISYAGIHRVSVHKSDILLHIAPGKYSIIVIPASLLPEGALHKLPPIS